MQNNEMEANDRKRLLFSGLALDGNMNITLENFLKHIFGDRSGKVPMVWIYQNDSNFYPDVQGFAESELLAVYRSNFVPSMTFREDFCNNIVNEIYWTQNGIVVTVSEPEEQYETD